MPDPRPEPSDLSAVFGGSKTPISKWVPIAMVSFSAAAMVLPIMLLRRQRAAAIARTLAEAPPPRRAAQGAPASKTRTVSSAPAPRSTMPPVLPSASTPIVEEGANGALLSVGAFGVATLAVGVGATATVFGVRHYLGVQTVKEFADKMREAVTTRMPLLTSRIHRSPEAEDGDVLLPFPDSHDPSHADKEWTWPDAEKRLREVFDTHGFYGWAAAAMRELEAEDRLERSRIERLKSGHA
ncbi:uncharacterized protein BXZ73DRAFT_77884 [Epithele typhae]|uniref:uncharacterized protein n=1 Tax=Epithele typhae TaxID=378194 RepID=UPI002007E247|nr:uncharacterized protein BXZ73DRAFT_77884 [Epithele typhae]KAH9930439.1 hypothetical protein BXZ73DRAFT_77884 [Epithele typhae]